MRTLEGSVVAITGAASGIGEALAIEACKQGASVAISDVNQDALKKVEAQCQALSAKVFVQHVDVVDADSMHAWADAVHQHFSKVNVIINNAGVALSESVDAMEYESFHWLMNINFWGVVYGSKAFLPYLKQADWGHIVNISSLFGLIGLPNQSAYNAAKFAVRGFSESLRTELDITSPTVSLSCVHPGGVQTNIANSGRFGDMVGVDKSHAELIKKVFNKKLARTSSADAAKTILNGVKKDQRRVMVGNDAKFFHFLLRLIPVSYQKLVTASTRQSIKQLNKVR